jgi:hypothetical protein
MRVFKIDAASKAGTLLQFVAVGHARSSPHASLSQSPPIVQAQNMMSTSSFISLDVLAVRWHWHCLLLQHRSIPWQSRPCGCLRVYVSMLWQLLSSLSPVPPPNSFLAHKKILLSALRGLYSWACTQPAQQPNAQAAHMLPTSCDRIQTV